MAYRYLKFSFCNAKLFRKNEKTKDFIANLSISDKGELFFLRSKRSESKKSNFIEPITKLQVSNMLHTLVGDRPVPSFRDCFYEMDSSILELASNSFLLIDSPKSDGEFIGELVKVNKSADDSWSKPKNIEWFKIKKYMGESFDKFIELISHAVEYNVLNKPFEDLVNIYSRYNSKLDDTINYLRSINKTPIINFLTKESPDRDEITKSGNLGETISSGIDTAYFLNGKILVPYDEKFVSRIIKNTTNILDGGYVKLEGILYEDELGDTSDFVKLSDISTEKH